MKADFDYLVPYPFKADTVTFTRRLYKDKLESFCLPFRPDMPAGAKVWEVDTREGSAIIFKEVTDELQPLKPYLVLPLTDDVTLNATAKQTIPASGGMTIGQTENFYNLTAFRGTLETIDKETAQELPAYVVDETVTAMDDDFSSTGTWKAAYDIDPFTAFLLPGANGTFTLKLRGSGNLILQDKADNQAIINYYQNKTANSIILQGRTLYKDGSWNTICLPFSLTAEQVSSLLENPTGLKKLQSSSFANGTLTLNFADLSPSGEQEGLISAGVPYLIKWDSGDDIGNPTFDNATVSNTTETTSSTTYVDFVGSFSPVNLTANDKTVLFLGADNNLYYPTADMTIGACRAVFYLKGLTADELAQGAKSIVLNFGEGSVETGISLTPAPSPKGEGSDAAWYDLQGRRVFQGTPFKGMGGSKGIYIHNGKKVVIK